MKAATIPRNPRSKCIGWFKPLNHGYLQIRVAKRFQSNMICDHSSNKKTSIKSIQKQCWGLGFCLMVIPRESGDVELSEVMGAQIIQISFGLSTRNHPAMGVHPMSGNLQSPHGLRPACWERPRIHAWASEPAQKDHDG